ncbi:MAG TPA: hypothetical protein VHA56_19710 [Mucilaginibacter sp.]|nr:hypothetical protein [Mucilaginibacter sp.]
MDVFFFKYRKMLLFASTFMFFYFLYEVYEGIEMIGAGATGQGVGTLINACITLFVSVYFFINIRKAKRASKEENASADANGNNGADG